MKKLIRKYAKDSCNMVFGILFTDEKIKFTPYAAANIHSYTQLHTPNSNTPAVQMARAKRVLQSLLNVGNGCSAPLMYMALTINK